MRSCYFLALFTIIVGAFAFSAKLPAQQPGENRRAIPDGALSPINPSRSKEHLDYLASDKMQGRNTPSPQLDSAAAYIAGQFRAFGLESVNGSYYNTFNVKKEDLGERNALKVGGKEFHLKNDFIPLEGSGSGAASGKIVFAGFGISLPDSGYDDYAGLDVHGKIVMVATGEPTLLIGKSHGYSHHGYVATAEKMRVAAAHGAAGLWIVSDPVQSRILTPSGYTWPSLYPAIPAAATPIKLDLPRNGPAPIPAISISGAVARSVTGGTLDILVAAITDIDTGRHPHSIPLPAEAEMIVTVSKKVFPVHNVVGFVRGSSKPDEYVVIGAHYDHIGVRSANPSLPKSIVQDTIFNGADDNASGTTGLLLVAEAYAKLPQEQRPERSILFIAFSGEERGLYGSRAYVANPLLPNFSSVAMLNMDMIGRNDPDSLYIGGTERSEDMSHFLQQANATEPFKLGFDIEDFFYRSDQASFARQGIPVLFFYTGDHPDYHQVGDNPDKIEHDKLAHVARLVFRTSWLISNSSSRPAYHEIPTTDPNALIFDEN